MIKEKAILCFGDSLTWGKNPAQGEDIPATYAGPVSFRRNLDRIFELLKTDWGAVVRCLTIRGIYAGTEENPWDTL